MYDFIAKYWLEVAFGLVTTGAGFLFKHIFKKMKAEKEEREAIRKGMLAILHDRLYQGCKEHIREKKIDDDDMHNMEYIYNSYHALGGNGTGTELFERIKKLPLKEE